MNNLVRYQKNESLEILKHVAEEIKTCLFYTNNGAGCRRLNVQEVDNNGNLWFFFLVNGHRKSFLGKGVQLFFEHPKKSSYLIVNGQAEIVTNYGTINGMWNKLSQVLSTKEGNPNISIVQVAAFSAYYWSEAQDKCVRIIVTNSENNMGKSWESI